MPVSLCDWISLSISWVPCFRESIGFWMSVSLCDQVTLIVTVDHLLDPRREGLNSFLLMVFLLSHTFCLFSHCFDLWSCCPMNSVCSDLFVGPPKGRSYKITVPLFFWVTGVCQFDLLWSFRAAGVFQLSEPFLVRLGWLFSLIDPFLFFWGGWCSSAPCPVVVLLGWLFSTH